MTKESGPRMSLHGGRHQQPHIGVNLSRELRENVLKLAEKRKQTVSDLIRQLLYELTTEGYRSNAELAAELDKLGKAFKSFCDTSSKNKKRKNS